MADPARHIICRDPWQIQRDPYLLCALIGSNDFKLYQFCTQNVRLSIRYVLNAL
jgi:hypothetical protein